MCHNIHYKPCRNLRMRSEQQRKKLIFGVFTINSDQEPTTWTLTVPKCKHAFLFIRWTPQIGQIIRTTSGWSWGSITMKSFQMERNCIIQCIFKSWQLALGQIKYMCASGCMLLKIRVGRWEYFYIFWNNFICLKYFEVLFIKTELVYLHFSVCHVMSWLVAPSCSLAISKGSLTSFSSYFWPSEIIE